MEVEEKKPERLSARGYSKEGPDSTLQGGVRLRVGCGGVGGRRGYISTVLKPNPEAHEDHRGTHTLTGEYAELEGEVLRSSWF